MNFMNIQVQIYLIVELFITIVESSLVLRQPDNLIIVANITTSKCDVSLILLLLG
jgi:hypothetical protein